MASIQLITPALIRFTYDGFPLTADPNGINDALNLSNYILFGPGSTRIVEIRTVSGDPASVEFLLDSPLLLGLWTLTVSSNIETGLNLSNTLIGSGQTYSINVTSSLTFFNVSNGANNDDPENTLKNHFNPALKGKAWNAIFAAIATGDKTNIENAKLAFKQLFISSASGKYLDRKGHDNGLDRPNKVGLTDELYRELIIRLTASKLTQDDILDVLEIFYGVDAVRAFDITDLTEPFALTDGDDLQILLDGELPVNIIFESDEFVNIGQAKAIEIAAAITRAFRFNGSSAFATSFVSPQTGLVKVKVYSGSLGLDSSIKVTGGKSQAFLQFSQILDPYAGVNPLPTWNITFDSVNNIVRFTTTTSPTRIDLSSIVIGDYVNVFGTEFNSDNRGSFPIINVSVSYPGGSLTQFFEVSNENGFAQVVAQLAESTVVFFRPEEQTTQNGNRTVVVAQINNQIDISIPATTTAVTRTEDTAAYLNDNDPLVISALLRREGPFASQKGVVEVTTSTVHGLAVGDQIYIDNVNGSTTGPAVNFGTFGPDRTDSSVKSIVSDIYSNSVNEYQNHQAFLNKYDGKVLMLSGNGAIGFSERLNVSTSDPLQPDGSKKYITSYDTIDVSLASTSFPHFHRSATSYQLGSGIVFNPNPSFIFTAIATGGFKSAPLTISSGIDGYSPVTDQWIDNVNTLATPRAGHRMTVSSNGKIQIIGGATSVIAGPIFTPTGSIEEFDPITRSSFALGVLNVARGQHEQIELDGGTTTVAGKVLVTGGRLYGVSGVNLDYTINKFHGFLTSTCETFDPDTLLVIKTGSMAFARFGHKLIKLPDGRIMAIGGFGYKATDTVTGTQTHLPLKECEIYDPNLGYWIPTDSMTFARDFPLASLSTHNGKSRIYVFGGENADDNIPCEYYDIEKGRWYRSTAYPSFALENRAGPQGIFYDFSVNDLIVVIGGYQKGDISYSTAGFTQGALIIGSESFMGGGLNEIQRVDTVISTTRFTYKTPDSLYWTSNVSTGAIVTPMKARPGLNKGPYIWDTTGSTPSVTGEETFLVQDIAAGAQYATLSVANANEITLTSNTNVILGFGKEIETFPLAILSRLSSATFKIDFSFIFPKDIKVIKLTSNVASVVRTGGILVTVTTTTAHGLEVNQSVYLTPGEPNFSTGVKVITQIVNSTSFRYVEAGIDISSTLTQIYIPDTVKVTKMIQKGVFVPERPEDLNSFYLTASNAGRIAAIDSIELVVARGVPLNVTTVYPNGRGLGNEGYPDKGNYKISEVTDVFGGDALDSELEKLREDD